jgi:hypothetical protein
VLSKVRKNEVAAIATERVALIIKIRKEEVRE